MTYAEAWKNVAARIVGLMKAGELHASYLKVRASDSYGRSKRLQQQCEGVLDSLSAFKDAHQATMPASAMTCVKEFIERTQGLIRDASGSGDSREERVWAALVMLGALETEMTFLLTDQQEAIRAHADRAFEHLQRVIVVDSDARAKWRAAFGEGETACERLGAVHLLGHGIWAFKAHAEGERTDLVYQEPIADFAKVQRSATGLVLTEWKRAVTQDDTLAAFEEARRQAARYAKGALAGIELAGYRYAVVVSAQHAQVPVDLRDGSITYRHVNIAADPMPPSKPGRKSQAKKG